MTKKTPHFLLFSEAVSAAESDDLNGSDVDEQSVEDAPAWHFVLKTDGGATELDVCAAEAGASPERLELLAVVRGLEALNQPSRVTLLSDSKSLVRGIRYGLDDWRENRWQWEHFGRMAPIKNADLWRRIDRAMTIHEIRCRCYRVDAPRDDLGPTRDGSVPAQRPAATTRWLPSNQVAPLTSGFFRAVRALFGWCGLCRTPSTFVIAPQ